MSLFVLAFLARPGGGRGGAEASPPRVRSRGAALEPTCWRTPGAELGAERRARETCGEAQGLPKTEHLDDEQLSCSEQRRRRLGEGAGAAARGAHTPLSPAAAVAWKARFSFASSALFTKLTSLLYFGRGVWLVRCAWPRVAWLASVARSTPDLREGVEDVECRAL